MSSLRAIRVGRFRSDTIMSLRRRWCSGTVTSSDGFGVGFYGRSAIVYTDKISRVYVGADPGATANGLWSIYSDDMNIGRQNGPLLTDEVRRSLILSRISEVFRFLNYEFEIE